MNPAARLSSSALADNKVWTYCLNFFAESVDFITQDLSYDSKFGRLRVYDNQRIRTGSVIGYFIHTASLLLLRVIVLTAFVLCIAN